MIYGFADVLVLPPDQLEGPSLLLRCVIQAKIVSTRITSNFKDRYACKLKKQRRSGKSNALGDPGYLSAKVN